VQPPPEQEKRDIGNIRFAVLERQVRDLPADRPQPCVNAKVHLAEYLIKRVSDLPVARVKLHEEIERCIPPMDNTVERDLAIDCLTRFTDQLLTDLDVLGMFYEAQCTFGGLEEGPLRV
jgi:hypothetical protein